jgi:PAS domain S-box-containing protein
MEEKKINILFVEDEESHSELITLSFESSSMPVSLVITRNLNEARVSIAKSVPDLVITDYVLPDGKGTELMPANKEEHPYPVVMLTGFGDEHVAVEVMKAGAFDYIVKSAAVLDDMPNICDKILLEWNYTVRQKRLEQELKESEARFKSLLSSLYESAVVIYDRDGKITALWGTPEMDKRYGIRSVDAIGRSVSEVVPPEQAEQRLLEIQRVFDAGEKMLVEYMVSLPGGSFWHETSLSPMMDANGNIVAVTGFIRDVTKRKQSEKTIQQAQKRLKSVMNTASLVLWAVGKDGVVTLSEGSGLTSLGLEPGQLVGQSVFDIYAENPVILKLIQRCLNGETFSADVEFGDRIWSNYYVPSQNSANDVIEMIGVSVDITERRKAEDQVRKLSHAVEQSSSTIIITDGKGNIEYANPKFNQLTGYSLEEAVGKPPRILKSGKTSPEVYSKLWETIKSGNEWRGEFCNKKKSGELYWESASISPVKDEKGDITNFIAVKEDITEQKKLEGALSQSEKLKSLGTITAGVAHEFNNILAVIMGSAEVLEGGFKDDQELKRGLKTIIEAGEDGAGIVKRMLSFAKAELSESDYISIDIKYLIKQAMEFTMPRWKNMAQSEGIKYNINTVGITETPEVFCNPTELREVFVNLIHNSIDAMPDGGVITMATRCVEHGGELKGDFIEITFSDTGKGMPEKVKRKIFDPFFTTRRPQGTGLGMSVTYGIMKRHGGNIEVESEVGKGAAFTLHIPIRKEVVQRVVPSESVRKTETKKLRVLVVDDEQEICVILETFLTGKGHTVKAVTSGVEAIELSRREDFDFVLCDLAMPEVTGYDVIKAVNELDKIPKIGISTGWGDKLKSIDEEDLKVDFLIKKPFSLSELERKISDF